MPAPGLEGRYSISNLGRIKSISNTAIRSTGVIYSRKGKVLKPQLCSQGYPAIIVQRKRYRIHRLVAQAFLENRDNLPHINHIDGCKTNNIVSNLEWCTPKHNYEHSIRLGLRPPFNPLTTPKVTPADVKTIRDLYKKGAKQKDLAIQYNIGLKSINNIVMYRTWKTI